MAREDLLRFTELVKADKGLQEQLRAVSDPNQFSGFASKMAAERGLHFTAQEAEAHFKETLPSRELSDTDLEAVSGGLVNKQIIARWAQGSSSIYCWASAANPYGLVDLL